MSEGKYNKKIKKVKNKKYEYSPEGELNKTLGLLGASNNSISQEKIDTLIKNLKYGESIGEITGLVIKDTPKQLYIMWDDDSLGEPILIQKQKGKKIKVILDTPEKLVEHYKESEKINLKTIMDDLKENPLKVFFMCKGSFKFKEHGYKMIWYDFMDKKDGKVYTLKMREINHLEFDDNIKVFDNVKIGMDNKMLSIKWEKSENK